MAEEKQHPTFDGLTGTLTEQLGEPQPWGELWRGEHPTHGKVLFVIYSTDLGKEALPDALPALQRWALLATTTAPGLARILKVYDTAATPHLIVADPGGDSLRKQFSAPPEELKKRGKMLATVAKTLSLARTYELPHLGLLPESIISAPEDKDAPWQVVPILPGARKYARLLGDASYSAPELAHETPLMDLSADVFALSNIGIDCFRGHFAAPHNPQEVPFPRVQAILKNGLRPNNNQYDDPKMLQLGLERWLKDGVEEDWKEEQSRLASLERTDFQQKVHENKGLLFKGGIGAVALLLLLLVGWCLSGMFTTTNTNETPYGTLNLYTEALIEGRLGEAKSLTGGSATPQTDAIAREIDRLVTENLASKFDRGVPRVAGSGKTRTAKIELFGVNGDMFMLAEVVLVEENDGTWRLNELFFQSTREESQSP